jgi:hypothetical protein
MNETSCIILGRDCLRHGVLITHITIPVVQLCELRNAVVSERQRFNQMVNSKQSTGIAVYYVSMVAGGLSAYATR